VHPSSLRKRVAFVMQDDALMATQTPREALRFSAALKKPECSKEDRDKTVEDLLARLGLQSCADTVIGSALVKGISGGERKRTSVGVELITDPPLVLLDEPTSGLDSYAACQLVKQLNDLSKQGRVVCCTIHQPSSEVFELFDRIFVLRKGAVFYQGQNKDLLNVLREARHPCPDGYNVADWLLSLAQTLNEEQAPQILEACVTRDMESKTQVDMLRQRSSGNRLQNDTELPQEQGRAPWCTQLSQLVRREFSDFFRDKASLGARMGTSIGQAILYALIFPDVAKSQDELDKMVSNPADVTNVSNSFGNEFGAIVGLCIASLFGSAQPILLSFPERRPVFLREYAANMYSVVAYFLSKTVVELVVAIVQTTIVVLITYYVMNLRANFFLLVLYLWLLGVSAASTALYIGCSVSTATKAIQLAPAIFVPQILFSGLFLKSDQLPVYLRWLQYLCPLKYSINLICIQEFADVEVPIGNTGAFIKGSTFLDGQDIKEDMQWLYLLILFAIFIGFRILATISLKAKAKYVF